MDEPEVHEGPPPARRRSPTSSIVPVKPKPGGSKRYRRTTASTRGALILQFRLEGRTFPYIAEKLGYSEDTAARRAFKRFMAKKPAENAAELRAIESARYERLVEILWPMIEQANLDAIDRFLRVSAAMRQLNGLDLEPKLVIDAEVHVGDDRPGRDLDERIKQLSPEAQFELYETFRRLLGSTSSARSR